jgi:GTP-binding protein HflX
MSDTVGFIRNLPTTLVKAFRATLEEVTEAAIVLHVVDASSPGAEERTTHVLEVLGEIGASEIPQILVINKIDRLPAGEAEADTVKRRLMAEAGSHVETRAVAISAVNGTGLDQLLAVIDQLLPLDPLVRAHFRLPAGDGATIALLHEFGRVLETRFDGEFCEIEAEIPESLERRLKSRS